LHKRSTLHRFQGSENAFIGSKRRALDQPQRLKSFRRETHSVGSRITPRALPAQKSSPNQSADNIRKRRSVNTGPLDEAFLADLRITLDSDQNRILTWSELICWALDNEEALCLLTRAVEQMKD
jgi:hypothetical protein